MGLSFRTMAWPDVLLHVTCLRAGGYQTAYEGARVHCQVLKRPRGLQAFRVLSMDESTAIHPSQLPQRTHVHCHAGERLGAGHGQVVQPGPRLRVPDTWRRHARHLRAHGDAAALRLHGAAAGSDRAGPLGHGRQGLHGGRASPRRRTARISAATLTPNQTTCSAIRGCPSGGPLFLRLPANVICAQVALSAAAKFHTLGSRMSSRALCPGSIHRLALAFAGCWIPATSAGMTGDARDPALAALTRCRWFPWRDRPSTGRAAAPP